MQGHQDRRAPHDRIVGIPRVAEDRGRSGVPIVQVEHVDRPAVGAERLEGGPTEEAEPPGVVGEVAGRVAVEPVTVERGRVVDQAQPIAVGRRRRGS